MVVCRRIVFDGLRVRVSREMAGITCAFFGVLVALYQILSEMNKMKHSFPLFFSFVIEIDLTLQLSSCKAMSNVHFLLPTHQRIMNLFGEHIMPELPNGFLKVTH